MRDWFGVDIGSVSLRHEPIDRNWIGSGPAWRVMHEARQWNAHLSQPYDLFINIGHWLPPFCQAKKGILYVLFPMFDRAANWPWDHAKRFDVKSKMQCALHNRIFRERIASYDSVWSNSEFTRKWTQRLWDADSNVLYPPVNMKELVATEKTSTILNVGRLVPAKKQRELLEAFGRLRQAGIGDWELTCAGGRANQQYFDTLQGLASEHGAQIIGSPSKETLLNLYGRASIFWHAMGYGESESEHPERMEHFGICTVEAMAAGCVPVVINRGGQREIVEHGVSGFLWDNLEELEEYTMRLIGDRDLLVWMSAAARKRSQQFSEQRFKDEAIAYLRRYLTEPTTKPLAIR